MKRWRESRHRKEWFSPASRLQLQRKTIVGTAATAGMGQITAATSAAQAAGATTAWTPLLSEPLQLRAWPGAKLMPRVDQLGVCFCLVTPSLSLLFFFSPSLLFSLSPSFPPMILFEFRFLFSSLLWKVITSYLLNTWSICSLAFAYLSIKDNWGLGIHQFPPLSPFTTNRASLAPGASGPISRSTVNIAKTGVLPSRTTNKSSPRTQVSQSATNLASQGSAGMTRPSKPIAPRTNRHKLHSTVLNATVLGDRTHKEGSSNVFRWGGLVLLTRVLHYL